MSNDSPVREGLLNMLHRHRRISIRCLTIDYHMVVLKDERHKKGSAPWQQQPSKVDDETHAELYKHLTHDWEAPLAHTHFRVEGQLEYVGLLYLPRRATEAIFDPQKTQGLKLFVKRVLVLENCDLLLPPHLRFMRGLVDSDDLPLNVSRELLQDSTALRSMQKQLTKRVLDTLDSLAADKPEDFATFTQAFGGVLKEGIAGGNDLVGRVAKLVRFRSTHDDAPTSLEAYVGRMKEGQESIYYATADNAARLAAAPQLEALRAKGYEINHPMIQALRLREFYRFLRQAAITNQGVSGEESADKLQLVFDLKRIHIQPRMVQALFRIFPDAETGVRG